ncbi:hypothetical protein B0H14DRAFT_3497621 [Mycena olivaceomarginata]|nr:hypothetical protein B0H14DRAFT_3497621 [Mycena olivaceomarginata]
MVAARVPPELVYIILGLAEYWAQIKFTHAQAVQLSASRSANADASLIEDPREGPARPVHDSQSRPEMVQRPATPRHLLRLYLVRNRDAAPKAGPGLRLIPSPPSQLHLQTSKLERKLSIAAKYHGAILSVFL